MRDRDGNRSGLPPAPIETYIEFGTVELTVLDEKPERNDAVLRLVLHVHSGDIDAIKLYVASLANARKP